MPHRETDAILKNLRRLCEQADTLQKSAAALSEQLTASQAAHGTEPKPEPARRKRRAG